MSIHSFFCKYLKVFMLLFLQIFALHLQSFARAGDLDPTFDVDGIVTRSFTANFNLTPPTDIVVQSDGKIIFASTARAVINGTATDVFTVIRYNPNGSIDTSFGTNGVVNTNVGNFEGLVNILLQPDGKIILSGERYAGTNLTDFAVLRYNTDGTPDNSFDGNGLAVATISNFSEERYGAAALQTDGKIVVVGQTDNETSNASYDWAVVRFNSDGSLDTTFDSDGKKVISMGGDQELAYSVAVQADAKIVISGVSNNGSDNDFTTARLNPNGSFDETFGTNGVVRTQFGNSNEAAFEIKIQNDNKIVVAGSAFNGTDSDIALARFNENGTLDASFGVNGLVTATYSPTSNESANSLAIQTDGKIVVSCRNGSNAGVVRFNSNGSLDNSFGNNGMTSNQMLSFTSAYSSAMAIQNDGKILISGSLLWMASSGPSYYFLARYTGVSANKGFLDYDGDSKTDIGIFRPSVGEWWLNRSSTNQTIAAQFGNSSDKIVPADFTGDGKTDVAIWRPASGEWFVLRSEDSSFYSFPFGTSGDTPIVGDFDADGKADAGVFRPSNLTWFISKSSGGTIIQQFGTVDDKPVPADYDGDGKTDIAIFRANGANGAEWWIQRSSNNSVFAATFGNATDKAVQGDYTGDGKTDIAVWRPSNGNWFILRSEDFSFFAFPFGANGDVPVAGDYDGDGKFDAGVFRPTNQTWYVQRSTAGTLIQQFGIAGDLPTPNAFVP